MFLEKVVEAISPTKISSRRFLVEPVMENNPESEMSKQSSKVHKSSSKTLTEEDSPSRNLSNPHIDKRGGIETDPNEYPAPLKPQAQGNFSNSSERSSRVPLHLRSKSVKT